MPLYEYVCLDCGRIEAIQRSVEDRDAPMDCTCYYEPPMKRKLGNINNFTIDGKAYTQGVDWARKAGVTRGDVL